MGGSAKGLPLSAVCLALLCLHIRAEGTLHTPHEVIVVEGGEVDLPCAISTRAYTSGTQQHDEDTTPRLIVWYREGIRSSMFSYDMRDPTNPRHWSSRPSERGSLSLTIPYHAHGRTHVPPMAYLKFTHTDRTDEGVYRCRVDFLVAPSLATYTKMTVLVPPSSPTLEVWASGRWVPSTRETPTVSVEVGGRLILRCSTSGGVPEPTLTWWRGGEQLMSQEDELTSGGVMRSKVEVEVRSEDAYLPIVCQASNTKLAPPLRAPLPLLVLAPPEFVRVEGGGRPMAAGDSYIVECRTRGATPPPVITWSVGGETQMYASAVTDSKGETVSRLRYLPKASHTGSHLVCTARPPIQAAHPAHTALPTPYVMTHSVKLNIMYKPEVELILSLLEKQKSNNNNNKSPPRRTPFSPSSMTPPPAYPSLSSPSQDIEMENKEAVNEEDEERLLMEDGKEGTGEVENERDKISGEEEEGGGGEGVREGEGVVFHCHVRANPPVIHVTWHKDGVPLRSTNHDDEIRGRGGGVVVGELSVVVGKVRRDDAGLYTCTAHNHQGATTSNTVHLRVIHGPECERSTPLIFGAPLHHPLNLTCRVSAYPAPSGFTWAFKSPRGLLRIPSEKVSFSGIESWISYSPRAAQDYGDLLCWARTSTGVRQRCDKSATQMGRLRCEKGATWIPRREPCVVRVLPADRPDPPERCEVTRKEPMMLTVACAPSHDGGLPQTFYMRVFAGESLVRNSTSVTSQVTVRNLSPGTQYRLILWSANTHGVSRRTIITTSTSALNTTSHTSSQNGHSSQNGRIRDRSKGSLLTKLGPPLVAIVTVIVVLGIVLGVVLGILTRGMVLPNRSSSSCEEDESEYEDHASTVRSASRDEATPPRGGHLSRLGESHRPRELRPHRTLAQIERAI